MSSKSKLWGKKDSFNGKEHGIYGSSSKQKDSPFHLGFKQHESTMFMKSVGSGDSDVAATSSSSRTWPDDERKSEEDEFLPSIVCPNGRHPRDPRPKFWEAQAAKRASSLRSPSKRSINNVLSYPFSFEKAPNNHHLERGTFEGWKPLKKIRSTSFSLPGSEKNGTQEVKGKNPRLSWGDGLAKFEKTKPGVSANRDANFLSHCLLEDEITNATGFAAPSFDAFTGLGDMMRVKALNVGNNIGNLVGSCSPVTQNIGKDLLEKIDVNLLTSLSSSIVELLECVDLSSSDQEISTSMNNLMNWKALLTKKMEVTEIAIHSLKNELKSLQSEFKDRLSCLTTTISLQVCHSAMSCNEEIGRYDIINNLGVTRLNFVEALPLIIAKSSCDATSPYSKDLQVSSVSSCNVSNSSLTMDVTKMMNPNFSIDFYFGNDNTWYNSIISSNKDTTKRASEAIVTLLPKEYGNINNVGVCSSSVSHIDVLIKEKFAEKQWFARFKERVLTIKYKAFNYLWERDLCLRYMRTHLPTSHINLEWGLQTINKSCKKKRSSIRHRFPFPAGKQLSMVPISEMISYTSQLLSESHDKVNINILKMPKLILDRRDKMFSMFTSNNGLVEDPLAVEKERSMINPWTYEERKIFLEKFAAFGKDFRKISSFLDHKTTADCVEFYYKNKRSDCFENIRKTKGGKSQKLCTTKTGLKATVKKRNRKVNVDSLQILNEAPVIARDSQAYPRTRSRKLLLWKECDDMKKPTGDDKITERSTSLDILEDERERIAIDALVSMGDSGSSTKAIITRSVDTVEAITEGNSRAVDFRTPRNVVLFGKIITLL
ncbi:hypothetical protein Fmac_015515 [Flemingia macrophylla]|uniref:SANT domain-containing protein n=1 Tax=Flemingia macrophylla TaxID=520843 RepID=A0ABD1MES8_9FABA